MRGLSCLLAATMIVAGCTPGGDPEPGPRFDNERGADITCMRHQEEGPGARYTDDTMRRSEETMTLLRYYTSHGRKPYCDGAGPTDVDRAWARLYVELGADPSNLGARLR